MFSKRSTRKLSLWASARNFALIITLEYINMGEKMDVRGNISWISRNVVNWKVPDFFKVPKTFCYEIESPSFSYMGGTWCLQCYPNWKIMNAKLKRVHSSSNHNLTFRIGIKTESGLEISCNITENFQSDGFGWGASIFMNRATLLKEKDLFVPQGVITFFCTFPPSSNTCEESEANQFEGASVVSENPTADSNKTEDAASSEFSTKSGLHNLALNLMDIYLKEEYSDLLVKAKEQEFKVHKLILGARSSVFSAMFAHDTQEKISSTVEITDCEPEAFRHFLTFVYSGQLEKVPGKQVFDLYYIADKYNVEELKEACANFLSDHITIDSFCDVMTLALRHKETTLLEIATNYFIKHADEINVTVKWLSFVKEYPLESNELFIKTVKYWKS